MKKLLLSSVFVLSLGFAFADTTGTTSITNVNSTDITNSKTTLLQKLESTNSLLQNSVQTLNGTYQNNTGYQILQAMGKISLSTINTNMLGEYFSLKTNLLSEYNNLISSKSLLDEKKSYGIITDSDYQTQLQAIQSSMNNFYSKYDTQITSFASNYTGTSGQLTLFSGNLATLQSQNAGVINDAVAQLSTVSEIISGYNNFVINTQKVKNLYEINYDNFFAYVKDVKSITTQDLVTNLKTTANTYYSKYSNLSYYSGDINNYIGKLFEGFSLDIDTYLNSLIKNFYTQDDYDFVTNNYTTFQQKYMTGNNINYQSLVNGKVDDIYATLNSKIKTVNTQIASGFNALGNPTDLKSVGDSLSQKVKDYYESKKQSKVQELTDFIEKQNQLLSYKLAQELDSYSVIQSRVTQASNMSGGSEKIAAIKSLIKDVQSFQDNIVDQSLKAQTVKVNAQLQINLIDAIVASKNYGIVVSKYPLIDNQLKTIMESLYKDAVSKNKLDSLNAKVTQALVKIDTMLSSGKLTSSQEYLIYKIQKAFIRFKYIR